jgi:hypothetical protein
MTGMWRSSGVRSSALSDAVDGPVYARFFAAEAALVGRLQHPNVVHIYDAVPDPTSAATW